MILLVAGLALFFATHMFSAFRPRGAGRDIKQRLGTGLYMGIYSLVALVGLVLVWMGYGDAPKITLYDPPVWGRHLNYILMPVALVALAAAYMPTGNIKRALKHPMLVAIKVWAFGHLLANGDVASVVLFGSFLAYAVIDRIAVKRRGDNGPTGPVSVVGDVAAIFVGLGATLAIVLWLHPVLFGVAVWPPA